MLKRKQHTAELAKAPSFVAPMEGDVLPPALRMSPPTEPRPHVVTANNEALPPYAWAGTIGVLLLVPTIIGIMFWWMDGGKWLVSLAWVVAFSVLAYYGFQLLSGDWPALREIAQAYRTRRMEAAALERMHKEQHATERARIEAEKEIELARIAATRDPDTHRIMLGLQATLARVADAIDVPATIAQPQTYVAATPSEAVSAAKRWVATMMASSTDGNAPPIAKVAMPWNGEWKAKTWAPDARQWLLDNVLEQHGTVYRWRDEFATVASAQDALRRL